MTKKEWLQERVFVDEFGRPRRGIMQTLWDPKSRKAIGEFLSGKRKFNLILK